MIVKWLYLATFTEENLYIQSVNKKSETEDEFINKNILNNKEQITLQTTK
jgi:hypothetical protein